MAVDLRTAPTDGVAADAGPHEPREAVRFVDRAARGVRAGQAGGASVRVRDLGRGPGGRGPGIEGLRARLRGPEVMCYVAAVPFLVWAVLLLAGVDADTTRVPF